jgi:hypothetical protein
MVVLSIVLLTVVVAMFWIDNMLPVDPFESCNLLDHDETLVIFPTVAKIQHIEPDDAAQLNISIPVHAWVFELEHDAPAKSYLCMLYHYCCTNYPAEGQQLLLLRNRGWFMDVALCRLLIATTCDWRMCLCHVCV